MLIETEQSCHSEERDWLTGIYSRTICEEKINDLITRKKNGVLLIINIDFFKHINDLYGHINGDQLLKEVTKLLNFMVFKNDILGRIDGDKFVIFMPIEQGPEFIVNRGHQIEGRLKTINLTPDITIPLSVTLSGALYQAEDTYQTMLKRAFENLAEKKQAGRTTLAKKEIKANTKGITVDMEHIHEELTEQLNIPGAYCQDYKIFKVIYRFVERRLERLKSSSYIILITLTDGKKDFPSLSQRDIQMDLLQSVIQSSLRLGDVFTRYSSCQFLIMVPDVSGQDVEIISQRICDAFYQEIKTETQDLLLHHCFPMGPSES